MKNQLRSLITLGGFGVINSTNAQTLEWAKSMSGTVGDWGYGIVTDAAGNVYTTGFFDGSEF